MVQSTVFGINSAECNNFHDYYIPLSNATNMVDKQRYIEQPKTLQRSKLLPCGLIVLAAFGILSLFFLLFNTIWHHSFTTLISHMYIDLNIALNGRKCHFSS